MYVLSKFAERYQAPTYSSLIRKALGRKLSASETYIPQICLPSSDGNTLGTGNFVVHCLKSCPVACTHHRRKLAPDARPHLSVLSVKVCMHARRSVRDPHSLPVGLVHSLPCHHWGFFQPAAIAGSRFASVPPQTSWNQAKHLHLSYIISITSTTLSATLPQSHARRLLIASAHQHLMRLCMCRRRQHPRRQAACDHSHHAHSDPPALLPTGAWRAGLG